jgi:molecular chaperone DnaK (HSP70)
MKLLANSNYWVVNKMIALAFDIDTSLFLSALSDHKEVLEKQGLIGDDGWFYAVSENIEIQTTLTYHKQKRCSELLKEYGFIDTKRSGSPAKLSFRINANKILNFLISCSEESPELVLKNLQNINKNKIKKNKEKEKSTIPKTQNLFSEHELLSWPTFDDFWNAYDKKIDKLKSQNKWKKLKQSEKEAIMEFIPDYKMVQPDKQYRKDPSTFLNNKSWENELIGKKSGIQEIRNQHQRLKDWSHSQLD